MFFIISLKDKRYFKTIKVFVFARVGTLVNRQLHLKEIIHENIFLVAYLHKYIANVN